MDLDSDGRAPTGALYRPPGSLDPAERDALRAALTAVAEEFVPSLSARRSTTQRDLDGRDTSPTGVDRYFAVMLEQHTLLVPAPGGALAAFCSFRLGHKWPAPVDIGPCTYVSTIAVLPRHRRSGLARQLYGCLFELDAARDTPVALRTWSTNTGHLRLLADLGFAVAAELPEDRGPGVGTVYLVRRPS